MRTHPQIFSLSLFKTLHSPTSKYRVSLNQSHFGLSDLRQISPASFSGRFSTDWIPSIASESRSAVSFAGSDPGISKQEGQLLQEQIMNGCEHFTIRDFVSEVRERDWRLTFPLPLPPDMTPDQIKALLPPMESSSSQFKRWNCEFFQGRHGAGGGLLSSAVPSDDEHDVTTRKDNFMADKINVAIVPADSDLLNTEKPKALLFDLNETPTPEEDSDEILENEELAIIMDNTADQYCHIANLAPVDDEKHTGNTPTSAIRSIEADDSIEDDIIPHTIRRRPVKYRALSELSDQGKREECQNVDSKYGTDHEMVPQPKKKIKLNKKKKKKSQHYSSWIQEKQGPEGCRAAPEKSKKKTTYFLKAGASQQSPAAPCAKRKHHQNENSKGTSGTQKEIGKKRRIFGDKVLKTSKDADQSSQVESGAIQRKIHKHPASLERVNHNFNAVVEHGNSLPTQRAEEAASEEADQQRSGAKQKKKNSSVSSGSDDDKRLTGPNSTIAKDAPQNETVNKLLPKNKRVFVDQALKENVEAYELCQPKSGIINPVSVQRVKLDSSSAIEKQNLNPVRENETESSTQQKRPAGKDTLGAQPRKRNCSEKFKGKDLNQQMIVAQQQKKNESDIRSRASKKRSGPIVGRESPLALPIHSGIHLLSIVATEHEELRAMSESDIHASLSADKVPPSKSALGYEYDGCVQVTVPTDYLLIDEEGDPFKLGPEDLPLRSHRLLKPIESGSKKVVIS